MVQGLPDDLAGAPASPRATVSQLGWRGLLCLNLFVGGTPLAALLNAVLWALTVLWFLDRPPIFEQIFITPYYYLGAACLVFGNARSST